MKVGCYVRVSTVEQKIKGYSIPEQIERTQKYCEALGWTVFKVYNDAGFSGGSMDRPALQQLIRDVKAGKLDKVLVYKLDRLSRSQKDTLDLIEDIFLAHGVDFISMSENFDTSTAFGRAMVGILAVFAQLEREQIKERMSMGRLARAKNGHYIGSHAPLGYSFVENGLTVDLYEKELVRQVFDMYSSGASMKKIIDTMNSSGLTHRFGSWNKQTLDHMLKSRLYVGDIFFNGQWYKGDHEPIIDPETFDRVQLIKARKHEEHETYNRRLGKASSYLAGYLYCGMCGAKYGRVTHNHHEPGRKAYSYHKYICASRSKRTPSMVKDPDCKNKIWDMAELDQLVFGEIRKLALDPNYYFRPGQDPEDDDRTAAITSEILKLDDQMDRLLDLYSMDGMPADVLHDRIQKLNDRKAALETEIQDTEKKKKDRLTAEAAQEILKGFDDVLDRGDFEEIRDLIGSLIDKIVLVGSDVTIFWKFN